MTYNVPIIRRALGLYQNKLNETLREQVEKYGNDRISKDLCFEIENSSNLLSELNNIVEFTPTWADIVCRALEYYIKYLKERQNKLRLEFSDSLKFEETEEEIKIATKERDDLS